VSHDACHGTQYECITECISDTFSMNLLATRMYNYYVHCVPKKNM